MPKLCLQKNTTSFEAIDPESGKRVTLFNPRQDLWQVHFTWSENTLQVVGMTAMGRATVDALNLNRPGVINVRRLLRMANLHPPN
jgi:hypothetical protein